MLRWKSVAVDGGGSCVGARRQASPIEPWPPRKCPAKYWLMSVL